MGRAHDEGIVQWRTVRNNREIQGSILVFQGENGFVVVSFERKSAHFRTFGKKGLISKRSGVDKLKLQYAVF